MPLAEQITVTLPQEAALAEVSPGGVHASCRWMGSVCKAMSFLAFFCPPLMHSQAVCGLTSMTDAGKLVYPPIARAAHLEGPVVLLATFRTDGTVTQVKIVTAPPLLDQLLGKVAAEYVKSWKANPYSGPRECPITVEFVLGPETFTPQGIVSSRVDLQHVRLIAPAPVITPQYVAAESAPAR